MATDTVPGADPRNKDKLARGCWAECDDGSLIFVKDIDENDRVIYELYDFTDEDHPVYFPHALALKDFERTFSYERGVKPTKRKPNIPWVWHDKQVFPWDKVMRHIKRPLPVSVNVEDQLSAARKVAKALQLRVMEVLTSDHAREVQGLEERPTGNTGKRIRDRLHNALRALVD